MENVSSFVEFGDISIKAKDLPPECRIAREWLGDIKDEDPIKCTYSSFRAPSTLRRVLVLSVPPSIKPRADEVTKFAFDMVRGEFKTDKGVQLQIVSNEGRVFRLRSEITAGFHPSVLFREISSRAQNSSST